MPDTGITKILISEEEIRKIVDELGREITQHYHETGGELVVVGLQRGSFVFMADLIRRIHYPLVVDFMAVSSYGDGTTSSGDVKIVMDLNQSVEGKHILLVEDIIDTGKTFKKVIVHRERRGERPAQRRPDDGA